MQASWIELIQDDGITDVSAGNRQLHRLESRFNDAGFTASDTGTEAANVDALILTPRGVILNVLQAHTYLYARNDYSRMRKRFQWKREAEHICLYACLSGSMPVCACARVLLPPFIA